MTSWEHHHPPHDHPDFDAYLDTLTEDDLAAITAATTAIGDRRLDEQNDLSEI
jgi:hypothetical protein